MNKKLTLSLDDSIIEKAKRYAEEHQESLSQIVEKYLRFLTLENKKEQKESIDPLIKDLLGSIKATQNYNYKKLKHEYLEDKHFND